MRDPIVSPLQAAVHRRLAELTRPATGEANRGSPDIARLADALRGVLAEHHLDPRGRCSTCRSRRSRLRFWRRTPTPCRAYLTVQLRLGAELAESDPLEFPVRRHRRRKPGPHYAR
ncbi:hypothetical protein SAMN05216266_112183 [Amycolatopsis marina]|uniref:Uncharacterized protein n=1 Tax=Amycolatopsis marina TaxID=490629 RepID=A0A1I1B7S0_9PSEU|nr:hypothetical protein SAMN05216266_112183 [Amycolatopsis marina]